MIVLILSVSRRIKDASDDTMMLGRNCFIQGIKKSAAPTAGTTTIFLLETSCEACWKRAQELLTMRMG
jgi:hypothetical protein